MLKNRMKYHLILVPISVTLLITLSFLTFVSALNSTIFVSVDVSGIDLNNVTTSIYDGQTRSEKTKLINHDAQNKTYFFEFDVKNVPESNEEERNYEDEDEDAEFRVCAFVDKNKNNYKQVVCDNILVTDRRENITLDFR
jgi:hypothetical protein